MKKLLSLFLSLALAASLTAGFSSLAAEAPVFGAKTIVGDYAIDGTTLVSYLGSSAKVTIPSNLGITKIGDEAFAHNEKLESVVIPEGVTEIGKAAFYCYYLKKVTLPSSLKKIGEIAFYNAGIESISLPSGLTTIGEGAFSGTKITSVTIPSGVSVISDNAFGYCQALKKITIQNGVTEIGAWAFYSSAITSIDIPASVAAIGGYAFYYCDDLTAINVNASNANYASVDGVLFDKAKARLILYPNGKTTKSYTTPSSVTTIEEIAFYNCSFIKNITLTNGVTTIGDRAFYSCEALSGVVLSNTLTTIGYSAFNSCDKLKSLVIPQSVTSIGAYAFTSYGSLKTIYMERATAAGMTLEDYWLYNANIVWGYHPYQADALAILLHITGKQQNAELNGKTSADALNALKQAVGLV